MGIADAISRVVGWLRAGYPEGVPQGDYVALLGVLHRGLTEDEVDAIAGELAAQARADEPITEEQIREMIREQIYLTASEDDVGRVSERLAAAGWDQAAVDEDRAAGD